MAGWLQKHADKIASERIDTLARKGTFDDILKIRDIAHKHGGDVAKHAIDVLKEDKYKYTCIIDVVSGCDGEIAKYAIDVLEGVKEGPGITQIQIIGEQYGETVAKYAIDALKEKDSDKAINAIEKIAIKHGDCISEYAVQALDDKKSSVEVIRAMGRLAALDNVGAGHYVEIIFDEKIEKRENLRAVFNAKSHMDGPRKTLEEMLQLKQSDDGLDEEALAAMNEAVHDIAKRSVIKREKHVLLTWQDSDGLEEYVRSQTDEQNFEDLAFLSRVSESFESVVNLRTAFGFAAKAIREERAAQAGLRRAMKLFDDSEVAPA